MNMLYQNFIIMNKLSLHLIVFIKQLEITKLYSLKIVYYFWLERSTTLKLKESVRNTIFSAASWPLIFIR